MSKDRRITEEPGPREERIADQPGGPEPGRNTDRQPRDRDIRDRMCGLASRGARLGAALLDYALLILVVFSLGELVEETPLFRGHREVEAVVEWLPLVGLLVLLIVQTVLLSRRGQSLGKLLVGIRIVRVEDGQNPGFGRVILARVIGPIFLLVFPCFGPGVWLLLITPCFGPLFWLLNTLFIFDRERRCLHDYLAATVVVTADAVRDPWYTLHK